MAEKGKDFGKHPYVINIEDATEQNTSYRTAIWTGEKLQVIVMAIDVKEEAGMEVHKEIDQFIRIEEGEGLVQMGPDQRTVNFERALFENDAIFIPAGTWHNIINTGSVPLKMYTLYAGPQFAEGTIHETKEDAKQARFFE